MAEYWLGNTQLDRSVFRSLRRFTGTDVRGVHKEVCRRLWKERVVALFQFLPDENDVWCALQRLSRRGRVDKYTFEDRAGNHVHYRVNCRSW
ncbi:MAG: hypothetical protein UY70_C0005G0002 [Candidatus Kaiserbacteria bacterium GW2011_GWB1_52_6]|uniref:Uncharacterized protein n=2 Tax=Candidatus Kaiseribacteriota TaxID=1752734 RepID=A0A0G1XHS3_9BACT|nr:MAG: hypothetical protein UY70_C0005G0002 [Candidatus Kaiserbacteria bacterium GW2011_GWB1_52_6]KKW30511.1 MAG: hypothetical protein UY74_C0039G0002 [Candidatus Kaiserbacteria bacterium GW2011_GWC2_52_8b]